MIVEQEYWNKSYEKLTLKRLPQYDPTKRIIEQYLPDVSKNNFEAFEMGCYPGRFLVEIGQKGYILNGCDLTPSIKKLDSWLKNSGCRVKQINNASYEYFSEQSYDLVASFGFIEHFEDYNKVFTQQCNMVKEGGILFLQYPNFRGLIQRVLHHFFDKDNLNNHVIKSMDLRCYKRNLPDDFEIIYCSYYGNFDFWIDDFNKTNGRFKKKFLSILRKTQKVWKFLPNSSIYSPYAVIIAKRSFK